MTAPATPAQPSPRRRILTLHRWLSLGAAIFWLLQAITGILIVFHWEITDRSISAIHRPTDLAAIERRIETLAPPESGGKVTTIWTTAGLADRYTIYLEDKDGESRKVRIAGDGTIIDTPRENDSDIMGFLVGFHHDLLGSWGSWIVSISGVLLCSNLMLGLVAAWPRPGTWRIAIKPATRGPAAARLYSWHRAVGLWAVVPALVIAATGTLMKFEDGFGEMIGAAPVSLPANPATNPPVGFVTASSAALAAIPGSSLTQVAWPKDGDATYRIRVRAPGEIRRAYGGSIVLVDANDGSVRGTYPIAEAEPARAFMSALFPIHTGEAGGTMGRLLSIAIGLWLITMIVAGVMLWIKRRKPRAKSVSASRQ
ncbi:hypothetical protein SKP52_05805 [Sphingopyxis fribergensis]|uniref:PepSY domain-containing protein n=1 Tax=Sphingopyxis fribergensis TaxID=1515612 RepID=A0A0A7PDA3_9SPHN|nr:PepSY-associated TM helix domain-containing protein [Sphingopyxis fribergensis]AJA08086.1 hypothetical protein SKP52_05805 [Sphingopyxis fribergensis]